MKTISVKEAAGYLGITPRAITYRLEKGQLRGNLRKNELGSPEWRIYPNKEIIEAMNRQLNTDYLDESRAAQQDDSVDAVEVETMSANESESSLGEESDWQEIERNRLRIMAEEIVKPMLEKVEVQAIVIKEKDQEIEDHKRQLRLLPDLQKQSEEDRILAERKALESEALKKQIAAMKVEKENLDQKLLSVESDLLPKLQEELKKEREEKIRDMELLEERVRKIDSKLKDARQFEAEANKLKEELKVKADAEENSKIEIEKLKNEKEELEDDSKNRIELLEAELCKYKTPWWKKFFSPTEPHQ